MYSIRIMDASVNQYVQFLREICEVWPQNVAMECNLMQNYTWIALANDRIYTMQRSKLIEWKGISHCMQRLYSARYVFTTVAPVTN